jgi:hypothetical protein
LSLKTSLLVQALKALGEKGVTVDVVKQLRKKFSEKEIKTALRESQYVTGWVYESIKKIADESI